MVGFPAPTLVVRTWPPVTDVIRGRRRATRRVSFVLFRQHKILETMAREGADRPARRRRRGVESTCGSCAGIGHVPAAGVRARPSTGDFPGRSGVNGRVVYLCSSLGWRPPSRSPGVDLRPAGTRAGAQLRLSPLLPPRASATVDRGVRSSPTARERSPSASPNTQAGAPRRAGARDARSARRDQARRQDLDGHISPAGPAVSSSDRTSRRSRSSRSSTSTESSQRARGGSRRQRHRAGEP